MIWINTPPQDIISYCDSSDLSYADTCLFRVVLLPLAILSNKEAQNKISSISRKFDNLLDFDEGTITSYLFRSHKIIFLGMIINEGTQLSLVLGYSKIEKINTYGSGGFWIPLLQGIRFFSHPQICRYNW